MGKLLIEDKCNCIETHEKAILDKVKASNENVKGFELIKEECSFDTVSYLPKHQLFVQYNARYTKTKVNGKTSLPATKKVNIFFTYCPFCGIKLTD